MNHTRNYFLAYSAFAADKYGNVHGGNLQYLLADLQHLRAGGEEGQILGESFAIFPQGLVFGTELLLLTALQECRVKFRLLERLGKVIERSQANGFHHGGHFVRAGEHDDVERAIHLHQLAQRLEAIDLRHQNVKDDEVGPKASSHLFQRVFAARDRFDVVAVDFKQGLKIFANTWFVIHYQNFFFFNHRSHIPGNETSPLLSIT